MGTMNRKEEIINGLVDVRKHIVNTASSMWSRKQDEIFLGIWNIKDLLAHLVGRDYTNIEAVKDIRSRQTPRVFEQWDPDWEKYNADLVEKYEEEDFGKLLKAIERSHQELIRRVEKIPSEEIEKDFGIRSPNGTNITVEWFLQYEIDDEGRHLRQIQEWMRK
jgi:hypothetical protein